MADDEKTFTQAEVDRVVRERLAREREKYADYDELKKAAEVAKASESKLDKVTEQLAQLTKRAEDAERTNMRREVAEELGLTAKEAKRLTGKTREDFIASGEELIEDFGIDTEARKKGTAAKAGSDTNEGEATDGKDDGKQDNGKQEAPRARPTGRPRETLRSGAPSTAPELEETDPLKLADAIMARR